MRVIRRGTKCCEKCGEPLFSYIEYELPGRGETDSDITKVFCKNEDGMCMTCYEEENEEIKEEEK